MGLEREHKWLVAAFPDVARLMAAFAAVGAELRYAAEREQHDTYFDTLERELQDAGAALRVRRFGGETLATYKGPGAVVGSLHTREEIEVSFAEPPALPAVAWPEAVSAKLTALGVETTELRPVLDLHTTRTRYLLHGSDANSGFAPLAELSFDEVRAAHDERRVQFRELELEALPDIPDADLTRLGAALAPFDCTPHESDKLTYALSLLGI